MAEKKIVPEIILAKEYTFDILAPADIPRKYLHVDPETNTAVLETEHGSQEVMDFYYDGERKYISFRAMLGSEGDELFEVTMKLYPGGVGLGEAAMVGEGMPRSPAMLKEA